MVEIPSKWLKYATGRIIRQFGENKGAEQSDSYKQVLASFRTLTSASRMTGSSKPSPYSNTLTLEYWRERWATGAYGWQEKNGNQALLWKHFAQIAKDAFPGKAMKDLKVFVPLCGKSKDILNFHSLGCTVVGIEFVEQPIREFFAENSIKNVVEKKFTKSEDGRIMIGHGDLFEMEDSLPFSDFDMIWDRAALDILNEKDLVRYSTMMKKLLAKDGVYLLIAPNYDRSEYNGPPLALGPEQLETYYGSAMSVQTIDSVDCLAEGSPVRQRFISAGLTSLITTFYVLKKK